MTADLDPTVLQLFREKQQPLDAGQFIVHLAAELEREERRQRWRRYAGLGALLIGSGCAMPWFWRGLAWLEREFAVYAQPAAGAADVGAQWLEMALLCSIAFGIGTIWRQLRNAQ